MYAKPTNVYVGGGGRLNVSNCDGGVAAVVIAAAMAVLFLAVVVSLTRYYLSSFSALQAITRCLCLFVTI